MGRQEKKMEEMHATWVEVNLDAIRHNVEATRRRTGAQVMAVVKANGYGHGSIAIARSAIQAGAAWCGVARPEEALELRNDGLAASILMLGHTPTGLMRELISKDVSIAVWTSQHVSMAENAAAGTGRVGRLHLKVDTGMGRLGAEPEEALAIARLIGGCRHLDFEGLFTHFARADDADLSSTERQLDCFERVLSAFEAAGLHPRWVHAANSAATLTLRRSHFGMVRLGIALYGLRPSHEFALPDEYRPALSWKALLTRVGILQAGRGVSYGHTYKTDKAERIGTVSVGYADGFRRQGGNQVLIGGRRVCVVGRVCMDQVMVQLDEVPDAQVGDEVVLLGVQGQERISAEEIAKRWGTICHEVTCGISARVPRCYSL